MAQAQAAARKAVHFESSPSLSGSDSELSFGEGLPAAPPARKAGHLTPFTSRALLLRTNVAFSPGAEGTPASIAPNDSEDGWKIEARGGDAGTGSPSKSPSKSPSNRSYTPTSATLLQSVQRVDDLRHRLEQLERTLREMESRAAEQLGGELQEQVLATALKLVQQRCLVEGALDQAVQDELLQTARKVVERKAEQQAEQAQLARRLEFQQQADDSAAAASGEASDTTVAAGQEQLLERFASHIEQGLGESMRRLERKAEHVAGLLDQGAVELLESQLTAGLGTLEARVAALEQAQAGQQQAQGQQQGEHQQEEGAGSLAARVENLELTLREQQGVVLELVAALNKSKGRQAPSGVSPAAQASLPSSPGKAECKALVLHASASARAAPASQDPWAAKASTARKASPRAPLPKLQRLHGAGAVQRLALESARARMQRSRAEQAERKMEEEEEEPLWVTLLSGLFWLVVGLTGLAALAAGVVAIGVKNGSIDPASWGLPMPDGGLE